ncbi:hypothetical protein NHH88_08055 [Oxalobacteraceae bacterium OTU3CAMAD1]|nr:hypothetical protein NHH88_08055 [Oxalobacteraceae bacterium OTU3CAMAD1]
MITRLLISLLLLSSSFASAASLTDMEIRWLTAGSAMLKYAKAELKLPIDIIVQPTGKPTDVPLALGFQDGRCKLVLTMRDRTNVEDVLASVPAEQRPLMIEAMFAHEVGHCWRYVQGQWHEMPAGFEEHAEHSHNAPNDQAQAQELEQTRREEGFADLAALAWIQQRHPEQYGAVAAWMRQVRQPSSASPVVGSHTTMEWLQLAPTGDAFAAELPLFEQASSLWQKGLLNQDARQDARQGLRQASLQR